MEVLVIIRGPLGIGKTAIAKEVSKELKAQYISVDSILKKYNLEHDTENGYISRKSFLKANEIICSKINMKKNIVIDGNFYWKSQIKDLESCIPSIHIFTLRAPLKTCIERNSKRSRVYDREDVKAVYTKTMSFDYGINIDATKPVKECVKEIISSLR